MNRDTIEKSNTIHGNIIKFLKASKEPKSMKEITEHILKERSLNTNTPNNTIRGVIQRSKFIKKNVYAKFELTD